MQVRSYGVAALINPSNSGRSVQAPVAVALVSFEESEVQASPSEDSIT